MGAWNILGLKEIRETCGWENSSKGRGASFGRWELKLEGTAEAGGSRAGTRGQLQQRPAESCARGVLPEQVGGLEGQGGRNRIRQCWAGPGAEAPRDTPSFSLGQSWADPPAWAEDDQQRRAAAPCQACSLRKSFQSLT